MTGADGMSACRRATHRPLATLSASLGVTLAAPAASTRDRERVRRAGGAARQYARATVPAVLQSTRSLQRRCQYGKREARR